MYPVNESAVEVLSKRVALYKQRALDERARFDELVSDMASTLQIAKSLELKAEEFERAINLLKDAEK